MSRLLAAVYDRLNRQTEAACLAAWRAELLAPLHGRVLEIGAGTGANLRHYPPAVRELVLAEPDPSMRRKLARHPEAARAQVSDAAAEALPWPDAHFDAVVSTLVLCSVRDPAAALAEIRRVLTPGGRLVFIEHVAADPSSPRAAWQRRVEPLWRRLLGNCHLTRHTDEAISAAGLRLVALRRDSLRKAFPLVRPSIRGHATR